jgi:recombination protein RecA
MMASFPLSHPPALGTPLLERPKALPLGFGAFDALLPEGGLPRGGVIELRSPAGLARITTLALRTCAAAQAEARGEGQSSWCAWVDPSTTLHAPGVASAGVDLGHLLVVRPDFEDAARVAVRLTASSCFAVVVVDRSQVPGTEIGNELGKTRLRTRWDLAVRRLALAAEGSDTTVLILSSGGSGNQHESLPTAMRLEIGRPRHDELDLCIAKERRGRVQPRRVLSLLASEP